jgi:hypothetical protein
MNIVMPNVIEHLSYPEALACSVVVCDLSLLVVYVYATRQHHGE